MTTQEALDILGLALSNRNKKWKTEERKAYELLCKRLAPKKKDKKT